MERDCIVLFYLFAIFGPLIIAPEGINEQKLSQSTQSAPLLNFGLEQMILEEIFFLVLFMGHEFP